MKFKKGHHHRPLGSTWSDGWALKGGLTSAKQLEKVLQANLCHWYRTGVFASGHYLCYFYFSCLITVFCSWILFLLFKEIFIYIFIYLAALGINYSMQYLVPPPGSELSPPALGAQSPSHWTTREVPSYPLMKQSQGGFGDALFILPSGRF